MTTNNALIAEAIERAALVIRLPGWWTQGDFAHTEGGGWTQYNSPAAACFCGVGSANAAAAEMRMDLDTGELLDTLIGCDFAVFNDKPGRTAEEVSDAMLACAHELRQRGGA